MAEAKEVPVEESKDTKPVEETTEDKKEVKLSEALKTEKKEPKMVPEAVLIEYKKENKELAKELKSIRTLLEEGATKKEVSSDLKAIGEKYGVDADFLNEVSESLQKKAELVAEEKLKPLQEKERAEKLDKIFDERFAKTLEEFPEYKKIISKDVIRALTTDPENANFEKIFQASYGHLVTGKKTLESTKPRGGAEDTKVDLERMNRDPKYRDEVFADPAKKAEYNKDLHLRLRL